MASDVSLSAARAVSRSSGMAGSEKAALAIMIAAIVVALIRILAA